MRSLNKVTERTELILKKYIAYLLGISVTLISVTAHSYYDDEEMYNHREYRWVCDPYTDVCHKVYFSPHGRYGWQNIRRKPVVPEPKFVFKEPAEKIQDSNVINVNLGHGTWAAYDSQGDLVNSGRVSGGRSFCSDINKKCKTATGTFTIYEKRGANCKSKIFPVGKGGAPMPYCMFFHQGFALHGSNAVPNFNASHGCVRMKPADAKWLHENFVNVGKTRVKVTYDKILSESEIQEKDKSKNVSKTKSKDKELLSQQISTSK